MGGAWGFVSGFSFLIGFVLVERGGAACYIVELWPSRAAGLSMMSIRTSWSLVRWTIRERRRGHWGISNGTLGFVRRMMPARDTPRLRRWGGRRGGGRSVWGRRWRVYYVAECRSRRPAQDDVGARGRWPACIVDSRCEERALRRPRRCVCCGISWIMD